MVFSLVSNRSQSRGCSGRAHSLRESLLVRNLPDRNSRPRVSLDTVNDHLSCTFYTIRLVRFAPEYAILTPYALFVDRIHFNLPALGRSRVSPHHLKCLIIRLRTNCSQNRSARARCSTTADSFVSLDVVVLVIMVTVRCASSSS